MLRAKTQFFDYSRRRENWSRRYCTCGDSNNHILSTMCWSILMSRGFGLSKFYY